MACPYSSSNPPGAYGVIATVVICLAFPVLASPAEVYRWVDEHGRVQYGDKPPADGAARLKIQKTPEVDPGMARDQETQEKLLQVFDDENKERERQAAESKSQAQTRRANCEKARQRLETARNSGFLYEPTGDPDNPRILTDEERMAETRTAEAAVSKWCGATAGGS